MPHKSVLSGAQQRAANDVTPPLEGLRQMTWFIKPSSGRWRNGAVVGYTSSDNEKQYLKFRYDAGPFPAEWRHRVPANVDFELADSKHPIHVICDTVGYILLSEPALSVLKSFHTERLEEFPLSARVKVGPEHLLQSKYYYMINPFRENSAIDIDRSGFEWPDGDRTQVPMLGDTRRIVLRENAPALDFFAEREASIVGFYFFSDRLKDALCDLGTDPDIFEACTSALGE
jgi:hypothetical protein